MSYFKHDSAIIDPGAKVGANTKVWHFTHIMSSASIGENCILGQNVFIGADVIVGNGVKIQNNVSVYGGVIVEDDVFLGPSMVFTNVDAPRSFFEQKEYQKTRIGKGASIGANATIVCGNDVGEYAFIGAGSVITKPVKAHGKYYGVPAEQKGWVSKYGHPLVFDEKGRATCPKTGEEYLLENDTVRSL